MLEVQHKLNCFARAKSEIWDFSGLKKDGKAAKGEIIRKIILTEDCNCVIEAKTKLTPVNTCQT